MLLLNLLAVRRYSYDKVGTVSEGGGVLDSRLFCAMRELAIVALFGYTRKFVDRTYCKLMTNRQCFLVPVLPGYLVRTSRYLQSNLRQSIFLSSYSIYQISSTIDITTHRPYILVH